MVSDLGRHQAVETQRPPIADVDAHAASVAGRRHQGQTTRISAPRPARAQPHAGVAAVATIGVEGRCRRHQATGGRFFSRPREREPRAASRDRAVSRGHRRSACEQSAEERSPVGSPRGAPVDRRSDPSIDRQHLQTHRGQPPRRRQSAEGGHRRFQGDDDAARTPVARHLRDDDPRTSRRSPTRQIAQAEGVQASDPRRVRNPARPADRVACEKHLAAVARRDPRTDASDRRARTGRNTEITAVAERSIDADHDAASRLGLTKSQRAARAGVDTRGTARARHPRRHAERIVDAGPARASSSRSVSIRIDGDGVVLRTLVSALTSSGRCPARTCAPRRRFPPPRLAVDAPSRPRWVPSRSVRNRRGEPNDRATCRGEPESN